MGLNYSPTCLMGLILGISAATKRIILLLSSLNFLYIIVPDENDVSHSVSICAGSLKPPDEESADSTGYLRADIQYCSGVHK